MAPLVTNQVKLGLLNRSLDLTTGTFYGHLITTVPIDPKATTVANLVIAAGGNYAPQVLADSEFTLDEDTNKAFWAFSDPVWNTLTTNYSTNGIATIKGMAICKQVGATFAPTDLFLCYSDIPVPYPPNGANFTVKIPSTGVLHLP